MQDFPPRLPYLHCRFKFLLPPHNEWVSSFPLAHSVLIFQHAQNKSASAKLIKNFPIDNFSLDNKCSNVDSLLQRIKWYILTFKVVSQIVFRENMWEISNKYLEVVCIAWPPDSVLTITRWSSHNHSTVMIDWYVLITAGRSTHKINFLRSTHRSSLTAGSLANTVQASCSGT